MSQLDPRPHSRACGMRSHAHGPQCHRNCPTCHGRSEAPAYAAPANDAEAEGERLTTEQAFGPTGNGHLARYYLAAGYARRDGWTVLDAACGTAYGAQILAPGRSGTTYVGVDRRAPDDGWPDDRPAGCERRYHTADLAADLTWLNQAVPDGFDVAVSFETIEHLPARGTVLCSALVQARRFIIASVPIVPTTAANPWHLTDWEPGQLADQLIGMGGGRGVWAHVQTFPQPAELSEIVILARRSAFPGWHLP